MNIRMVTLGMALALAGGGCVGTNHGEAVPAAPDDCGLVAHWTFDEGSGAVAKDVTGNGHDATLKNVEWVPSPRGQALRFTGKDSLAQYGNIETMMLAGDTTLAVWVRTDASVAPNTHRLIFGDSGPAVLRNGNLAVDSHQRLSFEWGNDKETAALYAPAGLLHGGWKHVVAVANSTAMQVALYVDGTVVAGMPMPLPISRTAAKERLTGWFYNGFFQGDLDDIRLYSRALSPAEVQGLFRSQADVTVGTNTVVYDGTGGTPRGLATVTVRNFSREPRRVEVSGPNRAPQAVDLPPGGSADVPAGDVPLTPVWRQCSDLFVCDRAAATGRLTVTSYRGDVADAQQISLTPPAIIEPLQVAVHDPWQAKMASGKTERVKVDVTLVLPAEQRRTGILQGRYPGGEIGNTFAVLTRSAKAPDILRQELQGLQAGRLYSLKVFTGDYADLQAGKTRQDQQVLSLAMEGAEVQAGGFSYPFKSCRGPKPFTAKDPFWMTYHWMRFRGTGPTATLSLSDWAKPAEPGGPVGQQTMVNFVEVQPVLASGGQP